MLKMGLRLIYDTNTGKVLNNCLSEMVGAIEDTLRPKEMDYLDLPYGYNDNNFIEALDYHIDITKDKSTTELKNLMVITQYREHIETEEERLLREKEELENQMLLMADNEMGGIL